MCLHVMIYVLLFCILYVLLFFMEFQSLEKSDNFAISDLDLAKANK